MQRTFRYNAFVRIAMIIFCIAAVLGGLYLIISGTFTKAESHSAKDSPLFVAAIGGIMIIIFFLGLVDSIKARIILEENRITQVGIFSVRTLEKEEMSGFRGDENYIIVESSVVGKKKIKISKYISGKEEILSWLSERTIDLDNQSREEEEIEIRTNQNFGFSDEERNDFLRRAKKAAKVCNWIGGILLAWVFFMPRPYNLAIISVIIMPPAGIVVLRYFKGLIRLDMNEKSAYPGITFGVLFPAIALMLRALIDYNIYKYSEMTWVIISVVSLVIFLSIVADSEEFNFKSGSNAARLFFPLLISFAYGYGSIVSVNCTFDNSEALVYTSTIVDKYVSTGKHTTYYLKLAAWGDQLEDESVSVTREEYDNHTISDVVNVYYKKGLLGIPWYGIF